jgi:hypothetical protein
MPDSLLVLAGSTYACYSATRDEGAQVVRTFRGFDAEDGIQGDGLQTLAPCSVLPPASLGRVHQEYTVLHLWRKLGLS